VNLRAPFYSAEVLQESLELATAVKMNDVEAPLVLDLLDLAIEEAPVTGETLSTPEYLRAAAERLLAEFPSLQLVAADARQPGQPPGYTRRVERASRVSRESCRRHRRRDAFTAAMTHYMLRGADLATLNEAGNRWAAGWPRNPAPCPHCRLRPRRDYRSR